MSVDARKSCGCGDAVWCHHYPLAPGPGKCKQCNGRKSLTTKCGLAVVCVCTLREVKGDDD